MYGFLTMENLLGRGGDRAGDARAPVPSRARVPGPATRAAQRQAQAPVVPRAQADSRREQTVERARVRATGGLARRLLRFPFAAAAPGRAQCEFG